MAGNFKHRTAVAQVEHLVDPGDSVAQLQGGDLIAVVTVGEESSPD
ncbi:hypothetical protein [Mycobacterium sp. 852002-51163_SCH5372311]|nr:hypothetical protein [Mycobacterium sp. 852002-51163_SCH5372311]